MGFDAKILSEPPGWVRCGAIGCALATVICYMMTDNYKKGLNSGSVFYQSAWVCLVIGIILLVMGLFGLLENEIVQAVDKVFHALAAELLIVTSVIILDSVFTAQGDLPLLLTCSGFFGVIYACLAACLAYMLFSGSK